MRARAIGIRIPLILALYGVLAVALLPPLIVVAVSLGASLEKYLTRVGSSAFSLAIVGLAVIGALRLWLRIARWFVEKKCKET